jgi:isoquinoline 1-oxidoreductase beta subunit
VFAGSASAWVTSSDRGAAVSAKLAHEVDMISFTLNGMPRQVDVAPDMYLRWVIRETLDLTGTKDQVKAQMEGGLVYPLTAALYGEIRLDRGRVQQTNFHSTR